MNDIKLTPTLRYFLKNKIDIFYGSEGMQILSNYSPHKSRETHKLFLSAIKL